ncbi:TPR domain-containing protein [Colletotrichum chrysophilum]|uniref:TPR domain-containing protein n=1 Tax=Colletotrichum chrysophilum TaxID=1836956 RepID=A0AAD9E857_9PEZI|nr:TPR domain-containing protein [Colletotrichum chrysophilum]
MIIFLSDEFDTLVTASSVSCALASAGRSKKVARRVAQERNADLRDFYLHDLSAFRSYHLIFVDESGCDKRAGSS